MLLGALLSHDILQELVLLGFALHLARLSHHGRVLNIGHLLDHLEEVALINKELLTFLSKVHLGGVLAHQSVEVGVEVLGV